MISILLHQPHGVGRKPCFSPARAQFRNQDDFAALIRDFKIIGNRFPIRVSREPFARWIAARDPKPHSVTIADPDGFYPGMKMVSARVQSKGRAP